MSKKKDSVAKGGGSLMIARLLGMGLSFVLFLVLARHSAADAGFFRTVVTYILMAEFLGMLGLHRWLSTEIAPEGPHRWSVFLATTAFTIGSSLLLTVIYVGVANFGLYSPSLSQGILWGALAVIPSGIFSCVQSALVGIGQSHNMGKLTLIESLVRCLASIGLILLHYPVIDIVWVFVITRWMIALIGLYSLTKTLHADTWVPKRALLKQVAWQAPRFAIIILAFVLLKNAGLVILPALHNEAEAGVFAVAYQLLDLILIVPSVLAVASNNLFVNKANQSDVSLRKISAQLVSITSLALFPLAAITAGFAQNFLLFLYGSHYLDARNSLMFLMLAACFMMVDQVLSQVMVARKDYQSDMRSILLGAVSAVVLTVIASHRYGATGASAALAMAVLLAVLARLRFLQKVFPVKLLWLTTWKAIFSSVLIFLLCIFSFSLPLFASFATSKYLWMLCVPALLAIYAFLIYVLGGLSLSKKQRMKKFLFHQ